MFKKEKNSYIGEKNTATLQMFALQLVSLLLRKVLLIVSVLFLSLVHAQSCSKNPNT